MSVEPGIAPLTQPIAEANPCGEDLEHTQLLASLDSYRLFGQVSPIEPAPSWTEIKAKSVEALARSKDLRVLATLAAALIRTDGLVAFLGTLGVMAQWLELYWEHVYPRVDEDAILRRSSINCFADRIAIVDGLRRTALLSHRQLGAVSLRDIELSTGVVSASPGDGQTLAESQIHAIFAASPIADLGELRASVDEAIGAVRRIETAMVSQAGVESAPSLEGLTLYLNRVQRIVAERIAAHPDATRAGAAGSPEASADATPALDQRPLAVGSIRSRDDALRALEAVAAFFRQNEPSSPVPLFIERARRLVAKDFLEVLADVVPEAISQAKLASGVRDRD
ncbi:MAG TPA: type VI secretion system protein TssA [Steroidobacteraceae bacterium]|nr:type VI secretion system protein TssA [Steroidobacteraceae bacterium]